MKKQRGLSLVELMIATVIGLMLMNAVIDIMLNSRQTSRMMEGLSRTQENGRFALDIFSRDIRMAGYQSPDNNDGSAIDLFFQGDCGGFNPCTSNGAGTASDSIAIQFDPPPDDGTETDCTGAGVGATTTIANVYFIAVDASGVSSLSCRGFDVDAGAWIAAAQPLIDGVDNLQLLYGEYDDTGVGQFVSVDRVTDWTAVKAVRVGMLVNAGNVDGMAAMRLREFILFDADKLTFNDRMSRQVYSTTFTLNNNL